MATPPDPETLGELCARHPLAIPLLRRMGVALAEPARPLAAACRALALDPVAVRAAVRASEDRLTSAWRDLAVGEVIDHIVERYHRPLLVELADLVAALARAPAPWAPTARSLAELRSDLEQHLAIEEHVLFPHLRAPASAAGTPIRAMQLEHADTIGLLLSLVLPEDPPALAARVLAIESWLCEHLHFENNELVPRALRTTSPPAGGRRR